MIISLQEINQVKISDLQIESDSNFFNGLLESWINSCSEKRIAFNSFYGKYITQLKFVLKDNTLFEKKYENEFWVPYQIPLDILKKLDFDEIITNNPIYQCKISRDFFENKITIEMADKELDVSDFKLEDIAGEIIDNREGILDACIDEINKKIYIGAEITHYVSLYKKMKNNNERLLSKEIIESIDDIHIAKIEELMSCFKDAFDRIHSGIPLDSIVRYRAAHHILLLKMNKEQMPLWFSLLNKHEVVDYSIMKTAFPFPNAEGILFVAKDRSCSQSTLKYINGKYIFDPLERSEVDIFDQKITKRNKKYWIGNNPIKSVCFLFDLIQNGKATTNTIKYYLDEKSIEDNRHMVFYCNGKRVRVTEIIDNNKCDVKIYSIYSGNNGRNNVQKYMDDNYPNIKCSIIPSSKELTKIITEEEVKLIGELYKGKMKGEIYSGDYLVVREFNQPKHNMMSDELLQLEKIVSLFGKRIEKG